MKKGLRLGAGGGFYFGREFESRPYEEGIKTLKHIPLAPVARFESRPYEEGIKTSELGTLSKIPSSLNRDLMKKGLRRAAGNGLNSGFNV